MKCHVFELQNKCKFQMFLLMCGLTEGIQSLSDLLHSDEHYIYTHERRK